MNQDISAFPPIFNTLTEAIIALDPEWRFVYLNPAAEELLGGSAGELLGVHCWVAFPGNDHSALETEFQRAFAEQCPLQFELFHSAPCNRWLEYRIHPSREGLLIFLGDVTDRARIDCITCETNQKRVEKALRLRYQRLRQRDITIREQADKDLQSYHEELESSVKARTAELENANTSLKTLGDNLPEVAIYQFLSPQDGPGRYTYLSKGFEQISGLPVEAALKEEGFPSVIHPEDAPRLQEDKLKAIQSLKIYDVEGRVILPSGQEKWIRWRAAPRRLENGDVLCEGIMSDVSKRRMAELALKDAHKALLVIKECGEAIAWASNESELLNHVCQTILHIDDTPLAWVGFPQDDQEKTIRVVAHAGQDPEYVRTMQLSWEDTPRGHGPAGVAVRQREPVFFNDLSSAAPFFPWREEALKRGYASCIALPLVIENRCLGVVGIYSSKVGAFHQEKVDLLKQLASDISHGIQALRTRIEREQLEKELLRISEREKQLIAQELHDGLCQHLAGASLMASLLQRRLAQAGSPETEYAGEISDLLNTGLTEARNLSHGLHPVKAEGEGLIEALAQLAQTSTRLFHTECSYEYDEEVHITDQAVTHLFRIAKEALGNAIKHGRPKQVALSLRKEQECIVLSIQDNGTGIPDSIPRSRGLGLQIMKHRAESIGATLEVRKGETGGTIVTCRLPV